MRLSDDLLKLGKKVSVRLAPEGETTIIMVTVCWDDIPQDLVLILEEIHR